MRTILVTGASGFLGKYLVKHLSDKGYSVIGTCLSESNTKKLERVVESHKLANVKLFNVDIVSDKNQLKRIVQKNNVDTIIHGAALKHVGICENNPTRAIKTNVVGSLNVLDIAIECDVRNVLAISTDKAEEPSGTYGMTKKLMEEMFLNAGFGVFRGVNFLFSSESVLEVWEDLVKRKEPLLVNRVATRYFSTIQEIVQKISDSMSVNKIVSIDSCYEVKISDLQEAFSEYHDYWNVKDYTPLSIEKEIEKLPIDGIQIKKVGVDSIVKLLEEFYDQKV